MTGGEARLNATEPRIVALGGGHGLSTTLTALRPLTTALTAIVTVADDGGSSGRLRDEFDIVPPGDLRMALSALCDDTDWGRTWRDVLQHRFSSEGALNGHALGNLLIAALWERTGSVVDGLDWVANLLRAHGRVLPLADEPLEIWAQVQLDGTEQTVRGQVAVATAPGRITDVHIRPELPEVPPETVAAIAEADLVVLGPGSWYSSVLPHFLVPSVAAQLAAAGGRAVLTLNIAHEDIETLGTTRADDVRALQRYAPDFAPAVVIADSPAGADQELRDAVEAWGSALWVDGLRDDTSVDRHDAGRLGAVYARALAHLT